MYYVCVVQLRCHHAVEFIVALFDLCGLLGFLALHGVKGSAYLYLCLVAGGPLCSSVFCDLCSLWSLWSLWGYNDSRWSANQERPRCSLGPQ